MDDSGTVFYLIPFNNDQYAWDVILDSANRNRQVCGIPHIKWNQLALRIGLDQQPKNPPYLVKFGRGHQNDVVLNNYFSRNDQCYFDFNKATGELLLHDISERNDTDLCAIDIHIDEHGQERRHDGNHDGPAVERQWILAMRRANFCLVAPKWQGQPGEATLLRGRLAFAGQPDPDQTIEETRECVSTADLQSLQPGALTTTYQVTTTLGINPHNTRFRTPLEPEGSEEMRFTKLGVLGRGGQGLVHKVVDMYTGEHYACKVIAVKAEIPESRIFSERAFKQRVEREVKLVQSLKHAHIVPYNHVQGFKIGRDVELFMPVYEGNLRNLIEQLKDTSPTELPDMTCSMARQILDALQFAHTQNPPIVHLDVKPLNIFFRGEDFFLADFGISKIASESSTCSGSRWYMAPEIREGKQQTPKADIWGLGVTIMECLNQLPTAAQRTRFFEIWEDWYGHIRTKADTHFHEGALPSMLNVDPRQRPTASDLLSTQILTTNPALSLGVSSPANPALATTMHSPAPSPMDWIPTAPMPIQGDSWATRWDGSMQPP
ncbi:hypothetical protein ED733_005936 [Metarhizium rileyi]|uniref:non-specific serine/threonine protein kinase n=1 Tax=Metarhizium rileyi (strain RCEF 4871) TaxID=1649241 RepID=A0A5C6GE42_METRR|nr:hypothetical protein ED733_005936 [Metarhizium rileyi]